jgi:hypothetical protein
MSQSPSLQPFDFARCPTEQLTPSQQAAMLTLRRRCPLSRAVLVRLRRSTVRAGAADYRVLEDLSLAERGPDGWHVLTGPGNLIAGGLARRLAREFSVPSHAVVPPRRSTFRPGLFSQAGNA